MRAGSLWRSMKLRGAGSNRNEVPRCHLAVVLTERTAEQFLKKSANDYRRTWVRRPSHQPASEGRLTVYRSWTADRHPLKNAVSEQGPYGRAGTSVSCRARDQATALRQASPVRRLMISKPLPFVCNAGVSARRGHLLQDRHNSRRFAGRYQIASWLPRHIPKLIKCRHIDRESATSRNAG